MALTSRRSLLGQGARWGSAPPSGSADSVLWTTAPGTLSCSHTSAWLVDFPCGFANAADNQSHSLICWPLLFHLLTRKHCWGPWESCTGYLLQALGKKSPVCKSVDHSGQKITVTSRPESYVLEGGGRSKPLHTPPTLATLLPFQDAAAQLDRSSADTGL